MLELSREGCLGTCPQYDLAVSGDGTAMLSAKRYMPFEGAAVGRMRAEYLRKIVRAANFDKLTCTTHLADAEVVRLSVRDDNVFHTIRCSLAGNNATELLQLIAQIHQAVLTTPWERSPPE
jgi:hypothetical protein